MVMYDIGVRRLVLASGSDRRRQLLPLLGLPFVIKIARIDERIREGEPPTEFVLRMSQAKAHAVEDVGPDELIVAADTIVVLDGQILGKPADRGEATEMLHRLRGRSHHVFSSISVRHPAGRKTVCELGETLVWMRDYTDDEIAAYVSSGDPLDKAGAYAIQHAGFDPVSRVEGCWLTVMGFPLCHLGRALAQFGVVVPSNIPGACRAFNQRDCRVSREILGKG
jgi:MAF protein